MRILLIMLWLLAACEDKPEYIPAKPQLLKMPTMNQDVFLPTKLWEELEAQYKPLIFDKSAVEEREGSKAKLETPREFFTFHIYLKEKTPGVLAHENGYDLIYTSTGGALDFSEFLNDKKGSFYFGFRPEIQLEKGDEFKVFYLSNAKISDIGGEAHGAGCDKYLDISNYMNSKMTKEGILLNTTGGRHVSLMAGTFFFATSLKGKLYLSQLTVKDSRFKKLHCSWK